VSRLALALLLAAAPSLAAAPTSPAPAGGIDAPRGGPLSGAELDARTNEIGGLLRCPVCQGLSVADSPSSMARNMKAEVRDKLAAVTTGSRSSPTSSAPMASSCASIRRCGG